MFWLGAAGAKRCKGGAGGEHRGRDSTKYFTGDISINISPAKFPKMFHWRNFNKYNTKEISINISYWRNFNWYFIPAKFHKSDVFSTKWIEINSIFVESLAGSRSAWTRPPADRAGGGAAGGISLLVFFRVHSALPTIRTNQRKNVLNHYKQNCFAVYMVRLMDTPNDPYRMGSQGFRMRRPPPPLNFSA